MGLVRSTSSRMMVYIVVATEYLSKWAKSKAVKRDMAIHTATFMYGNIIVGVHFFPFTRKYRNTDPYFVFPWYYKDTIGDIRVN